MASPAIQRARARTDGHDRLVEADEPLAGFHRRCGGELPGGIVTPALLEMVRTARRFGFRLAREMRAQDDREAIRAWVEIDPDDDGCTIAVSNWHAQELPDSDIARQDDQRVALARHMADLSARLGPRQELLAVEALSEELAPLAQRMGDGIGAPWTDFVMLAGNAHKQPMHWRLLDGAKVQTEGCEREFEAIIVPLGKIDPGASGFELYLVSDEPAPQGAAQAATEASEGGAGIGLEIAPVLRQPIARIIANAETIRAQLAGPLAEEYSEYASDIAAAGEHLLALVEDLTTLEVVEAQDFSPEPDQIDLVDVASRAAGILQVRAGERGIVIHRPDDGETAPAIGEFRRVLQILLNLIGNAIRYSPEGAQMWLHVESNGQRARITVSDEGEGLDQEQQVRAFEKFERLERTGDGGSGLGLYISRRLAEAMGGSLTVESAKGEGARFTLELPADEA